MRKNISFFLERLKNKLWFKPLIFVLLSVAAALIAHFADDTFIAELVPEIDNSSLEDLLATISGVMLVIAIFAVGSMLSAFSAASGSATPRSFELIVSDDVSQNALSVYIGSFIFSIVAEIALKNGFYGKAGHFILFVLTIFVFTLVILTFLRWVERISKLGRLGHTILKVEEATTKAVQDRLNEPLMGGLPVSKQIKKGEAVYSDKIGYVQHINIEFLQKKAEDDDLMISINCLPGAFTSPDKPILFFVSKNNSTPKLDHDHFEKAFIIEKNRSFQDDPRFGLIALSEIASRALSPGINDPGTAIAIIGSHVRIFALWFSKGEKLHPKDVIYNRVEVPEIHIDDLFYDAFRPIARDGADNIEVMLRLQKAFATISHIGSDEVKKIVKSHSALAFHRAEQKIESENDLAMLKKEFLRS